MWVSLVLRGDLHTCVFCPAPPCSARAPWWYFCFVFFSYVAPVTSELWHDHFSQPFAGDKESQVAVSSVGLHFTDSYKAGNCDGGGIAGCINEAGKGLPPCLGFSFIAATARRSQSI